ncbi:MAG TPA: NAD(P)-dependent oxidoreductase [Burkholderiales bacterium]|nr:NAD(P)-dependent oxidoreductase [Burkholderiales bacterium]
MKPVVGVIGLGIMGGAMAEALLGAGYRVQGYDVAPAARRRLERAGGKPRASTTAVAQAADIVIVSIASVAALDDAVERMTAVKPRASRPGPIVIEMSTLPIADKERARLALARAGMTLLDVPVSGTAVRMQERAWTLFVSGPRAAFARVRPVLEVFSDNIAYVGAFGNGSRMKFIANHLVAIQNVAVAEALTFARKMGLDARAVWKLFAPSPVVGTGVFRLRGGFMVERRYLPATMKVGVWQKDMQVIGDMAKSVDCPTPLFTACVPVYHAAMAQGLGDSDTASVCEVLGAAAGIAPRRGSRRSR